MFVRLGENRHTFNYLRCKATINYKSVTLPHKTVLWYSVCVFLMAQPSNRARKGRTSPERCVAIVRPELSCTFLKCSRCPTKCHRCARSQSDKYVKTSFVYFEPADCLLRVANGVCRRVTLYSVKSCRSRCVCGVWFTILSAQQVEFHSVFPDKSISLNCWPCY